MSAEAASTATGYELTNSLTKQGEGGKGGEGGDFQITNAEFIAAVFPQIPDRAYAAVCSKPGNPSVGGWPASRADKVANALSAEHNNYVTCASFYPGDDGVLKARKARFSACHFLMLDDLGTKVPLDRVGGLELSWLIETSPENYQGGIILAERLTEGAVAVRLLNAVIDAGLCDAGATGPLSRWARLPVAINGKPKYAAITGGPFRCRLREWRPSRRYTPEEIVNLLALDLAPAGRPRRIAGRSATSLDALRRIDNHADAVLIPKAEQNPIVSALKVRGLYKTPLGGGKHDVTCPWVREHTDELDTGAAYFEPDELYPVGGFCCQHSHREKYHIRELLTFLGVPHADARHKPVIRVVAGDLDRVVDAAERELANRGRHYQAGSLIVSVSTDPTSGDPSILPTSGPALTRELSAAATWEKYDGRTEDWLRCDPPTRHVAILFDSQRFRHLPPLAGVARQPYFRESDGELITHPGYDRASRLFGVFDARQFVVPDPDPATALLEQVRHDPDGDALIGLMTEWHAVFGSVPTTVRKVVEAATTNQPNLLDAIREFPVEERGEINRSKLGWLLRKNANRIVRDLKFEHGEADGRPAWRVVIVETPPSPPLPPFAPPIRKTVAAAAGCADTPEEKTSRIDVPRGMPLADWKATELNRLFQDQGITGQPGRITGASIRRSEDSHKSVDCAAPSEPSMSRAEVAK